MESRDTVAMCFLSAVVSLAVMALVWASITAVLQKSASEFSHTSLTRSSSEEPEPVHTVRSILQNLLSTLLPPAAILDVPDLYSSIEGCGDKMSVFKKDAA